jgi:ubiquinone biosynthesis protein
MTLEGVVRTLAPQIELLSKIEPYLERVMKDRWAPSRVLREVQTEFAELLQSVRTYPVNLAEILQRVADGRLRLDANLQNTERIERRLQELSSRLPLALLVFALLVSSSLLLFSSAQGGGGSLRPTLGMIGYIGAIVLILRIFLKG